MFVCRFYLFSEKKTFPHSAPMTHTINETWGGNFIQVTVQDWGMYAYLWCSIPSIATMYNYRGSTSVYGISYLNRTSENDLKISVVCKNRMTEMLNICRGKKEPHEIPYVVVTTFFNITAPSRRKAFKLGSYRLLDLKFKTFSRLFSKTIISFSRLEVIK